MAAGRLAPAAGTSDRAAGVLLDSKMLASKATSARGMALGLAVAAAVAVPSLASGPSFPVQEEPPPGVTVTGGGLARVVEPDRPSNESIARAVEAAHPVAVTRAVYDAKSRATAIAEAAGVQLGDVQKLEFQEAFGQFGRAVRPCRRPHGRLRCRVPPFTAVAATVTYEIVGGADGSEDGREIESYAGVSAAVEPKNERSSRSIRQALLAARQKLTPRAVAAARRSVDVAAQAGDVSLGPVVSIAEQRDPYPPFDATLGSFGPGRFCGFIRRSIFRRDPETGNREVVGRVRRRRCYFPRFVTVRVGATYEAR
jgi:hypothetical protein